MFLVVIRWVCEARDTYCVITETKQDAKDYIDEQMEGGQSNGTGYYMIIELPLYKKGEE